MSTKVAELEQALRDLTRTGGENKSTDAALSTKPGEGEQTSSNLTEIEGGNNSLINVPLPSQTKVHTSINELNKVSGILTHSIPGHASASNCRTNSTSNNTSQTDPTLFNDDPLGKRKEQQKQTTMALDFKDTEAKTHSLHFFSDSHGRGLMHLIKEGLQLNSTDQLRVKVIKPGKSFSEVVTTLSKTEAKEVTLWAGASDAYKKEAMNFIKTFLSLLLK